MFSKESVSSTIILGLMAAPSSVTTSAGSSSIVSVVFTIIGVNNSDTRKVDRVFYLSNNSFQRNKSLY